MKKSTPKVKVPKKAEMDKADNGKGFKKVPKGAEKGTTKFVPPWMKKNTKKK